MNNQNHYGYHITIIIESQFSPNNHLENCGGHVILHTAERIVQYVYTQDKQFSNILNSIASGCVHQVLGSHYFHPKRTAHKAKAHK